MKKAVFAFVGVVLGALLAGCQSPEPVAEVEKVKYIEGTVTYRERIALPDGATVTVVLEDISKADAQAVPIAKYRFVTNGEQVPIDFKLGYDTKKIKEGHTYNVRAQISIDKRLRFTTDEITAVLTDANKTDKVDLFLVGTRGR